jgi:hypothetical protein
MTLLNISQAAKAAGKDRNTLKRYMKDGRLSSTKNHLGNVVIDTDELVRVFGALKTGSVAGAPDSALIQSPQDNILHQLTIETLREQLRAAQEREEWLKSQLAEERARNRELERRMLPPGGDAPAKKGFLSRIFGK